MTLFVLILFALSRPYHKVTIAQMGATQWTHVEVTGKVTLVKTEADGDTHIRLSDGQKFIVAECIPVLPCPRIPHVGEIITVRGVSRLDKEHGWYEVHPVESLK
jgi:hypothetical protein